VDRRLRDSCAAGHFRKGQLSVGRGVGAEVQAGTPTVPSTRAERPYVCVAVNMVTTRDHRSSH
jgi:hypothetical protein